MILRVLRPRLKRLCQRCSNYFLPYGRHNHICPNCNLRNKQNKTNEKQNQTQV